MGSAGSPAAWRKASFGPITDAGTRLLMLGSLPGEVSLARSQYYAHPRNQFWRLMAEVLGDAGPAAPDYEVRLEALRRHGVGLWDVVRSAYRAGSLDANIREHEPNALQALTQTLPSLTAVAFNGATASTIGRKLLAGVRGLTLLDLPSSSPALTAPFETKLAAWLRLRPFVRQAPD
jgi:TDG/mug DNA glycosylase family protein